MSDQDVHDGMKIFCDWFKDRMKESDEATTWKIPLECIPNPKKVWLTIEEAKTIEHCFAIFQKHFKLFEPEMKVWQELRKRIEQAEGKS